MKEASFSIVHVVVTLERGGLERLVTDLAIEQARAGHQVAVFSLHDTRGFAPTLREAGIEVVIGHKRGGIDFGALRALRALVRRRQADIVHTHNFMPNYYAALAMLGLRRAPPLVGTCHDMGTRLDERRLRLYYKASLWRTARVAMVGRQVHARFVEGGIVPARKADTVLNAVPLDRFAIAPTAREAARRALSLDADALVIGCVGRLVSLKNHALMIELMPALLQQHPRARLVLLGGGELEQTLRAQAERLGVAAQVLLTGERDQVADLLPAFDVFALPSRTEGVSIALLEGCASGLAVMATDVGGNPEIIAHDRTGLLVAADDPAGTLKALLRLLGEADLRHRLGHAARDWVRANASLDALRRRYDALYRQARSEGRGETSGAA
jgi:glycosyltransferase involved in cell wall biosynthesis